MTRRISMVLKQDRLICSNPFPFLFISNVKSLPLCLTKLLHCIYSAEILVHHGIDINKTKKKKEKKSRRCIYVATSCDCISKQTKKDNVAHVPLIVDIEDQSQPACVFGRILIEFLFLLESDWIFFPIFLLKRFNKIKLKIIIKLRYIAPIQFKHFVILNLINIEKEYTFFYYYY